jgi:hypothetical protein
VPFDSASLRSDELSQLPEFEKADPAKGHHRPHAFLGLMPWGNERRAELSGLRPPIPSAARWSGKSERDQVSEIAAYRGVASDFLLRLALRNAGRKEHIPGEKRGMKLFCSVLPVKGFVVTTTVGLNK